MERSEAIYLFEDSKNRIKWFLKDIDEDINGSNRLVFKGTVSVQLYDIAENVGKVVNYIRDGKRDADRLKSELLNLRIMVKELQSKSLQKGYEHFAYNCRMTISIIDNMEKWETNAPNPENSQVQETNQSEIVPETKADKENPKNKAQIMMSIDNEPFKPKKDGKPIPYQKCFERLTMGKIRRSAGESEPVEVIDKRYDSELFKYCVDRANIKYLIKEKKCFAYLFLRCISEYFENPFEYRKAAAMSFGIKTISNVGGDTKSDFYNLFSGVFKNEDIPRKKRK